MSKYFLDSNVCVYAFSSNEGIKRMAALALLENPFIISSQVMIETHNVCLKKLKINPSDCENIVLHLLEIAQVHAMDSDTISKAISIKRKYLYTFLDSLIVAAALQSGCTTLYTEDMQHNQVIENTLTIVNPFI